MYFLQLEKDQLWIGRTCAQSEMLEVAQGSASVGVHFVVVSLESRAVSLSPLACLS